MMNKGFTAIELILALAISSVVVFSVLSIPADLMRVDGEYTMLLTETNDLSLLKKAIINDLKQDNIEQGADGLVIGDSLYTFDDGVKWNGKTISETDYSYELNNDTIRVYNDDLSFTLYTSTSFRK